MPDVITSTAAVSECQIEGPLPDVITHSAAISACEKGQKPQQALHLLQELQLRGLLPDVIISKLLTGALGRFRLLEPIEGRTG